MRGHMNVKLIPLDFYMFRKSYVYHQEHYIVHAALYGILSMRLCKQSSRVQDVFDKKTVELKH
jgi:hypothetical protein